MGLFPGNEVTRAQITALLRLGFAHIDVIPFMSKLDAHKEIKSLLLLKKMKEAVENDRYRSRNEALNRFLEAKEIQALTSK